jgi:hypothetical protein
MTKKCKTQAMKETINKLDFIKSKEAINQMQRPPIEWEKIFANHVSDKGLKFQMHK